MLDGVSAALPVGASCLFGPSGSGKSTVLRLLDEPTSALDAEVTAAVERTMARLRARTSISLVLVTHDLEQAARVAERIVCIEAGRVVREGPAAEIAAAERERHMARAGGPATEVADAAGSGPATEPMGRRGTQP